MGFSILQMDGDSFVMWSMRIVYIALLVVVLLVTVSRLRFPIIINRVRRALGSKHVFWRRFILNSCMLAAIVMMLFMVDPVLQHVMILLDLCGFAILSFGNLQIPAAIVREELARMRLTQHDSFGVVESVNLYYAYAFDKYMEGGVFAPKRINLSNFAIDSINSDLSKNQLYGIRMMHTFLQRDPTRAQLLEKLTTSTQTKARLINMLDWTDGNHHTTVGKKQKEKRNRSMARPSPVEASGGPVMGDITGGGGELRVQIAANSGGQGGKVVGAAPEKCLNRFVRVVALMERTGNALGTLAFTWATVILLGGYPTVLDSKSKNDYWLVLYGFGFTLFFNYTILVLFRMFSSDKSDYQLFFRARGAFRFLGGNGLIVIVFFWDALAMLGMAASNLHLWALLLLSILLKLFLRAARRSQSCNWPCRAISLWSPVFAILLLASPILHYYHRNMHKIIFKNSFTLWIPYAVLSAIVLLVTISRLRFPNSKHVFWRQFILNSCMFAAIVMLVVMVDPNSRLDMIVIDICAAIILSFGNLHIPAALVRVSLAGKRLAEQDYFGVGDNKANLGESLTIFYSMVLGQGMLYIVAGMLEFFSFIPRRTLVRRGRFTGQWGVESVNLYYTYAFEKNMEGGVFAAKRISLSNFAMDSINSDLSKKQLYGIRMMHIFLQRDPTRAQLLEKLTTSTQTMARLISMLGWTSRNDHTTIRLYAAKVTAELAKSLRVVTVPGTMYLVSTLLDTDRKPKRRHPLLDEDDDRDPLFVDTVESQEKSQDAAGDQGQKQGSAGDTDIMLKTPTRSTHMNNPRSTYKYWERISECESIPKEQPLTFDDLLPALGMSIVYSLAGCDQNNSVEIDRVTDLIPKIIGFTSFTSATVNFEEQQKVLLKSSLKVLQRLTSIEGEIGITLRHKISKHPFLLRSLAEILGDNSITPELRKLVAEILRNLAIDRDARQEIGQIQVLITRLMKAFLNCNGPSSTNADCLLPKVAGQALAMLASENVDNCLVMSKEPEFINKLRNMILIHDDNKYIYVAASLLRNLCMHAQPELMESDLKGLSHILPAVLERIMDAEGPELEILIGLSSQICKVLPEEFSQELEHRQIKRRFIERLVDLLNANMKPSAHCPGIRRVILEQSIYMMECNSHYANCFNEYQMMDALSIVELTSSRAENYMVFLGDAGFMECRKPLLALVDRTKELMGRQWLQGINSAY
uniref:BLE2 protein n=1 Tax=Oryza glumipatula TaxID=40148 RepID=A0A0E0ANN0_9ORYZ